NAHRRRVLVSVNPRELYHVSRLREDAHAQWDIKNTARDMLHLAKQVAPLTFMLSGGKDEFEKLK
ncbi:MAG: FAD-dependent thymidylate synthase, partial [Candidatus Cloacimonetes bacterium]|nr:FAD-dependent thymidylate synthase [Candidatus Cloacimonadota bacterium]